TGYLFSALTTIVFRLDVEVPTEQIDYRKIRGSFVMREGNRFQHNPSGLRGCFELMEQARLAYARIGHRGDDLAASGLGGFRRVLERLHLGVAANEFRVASSGRALQPRAQRAETGYLKNLDGLGHAFNPCRTNRPELEISLDKFPRRFANHYRA